MRDYINQKLDSLHDDLQKNSEALERAKRLLG